MKYISIFSSFFRNLLKNRGLLWKLSVDDFKSRYASSFLGVAWAFLQPILLLVTMWFAFQVALGNGDQGGFPFILWFAPGLLAWNFFSESINSMTSSIRGYSYLVRKVNFRVSILPIVKMVSAFFVHVGMLFIVVGIMLFYGYGLTIYTLQLFYYLLCMFVLLLGLGWLLSAISLFAPDVVSIVGIVLNMGFWASPIAWNPDLFASSPTALAVLRVLNPMFYVIEGYRDTFLGRMWFWERSLTSTLVFWVTALLAFLVGSFVFNRLRPQFADVL